MQGMYVKYIHETVPLMYVKCSVCTVSQLRAVNLKFPYDLSMIRSFQFDSVFGKFRSGCSKFREINSLRNLNTFKMGSRENTVFWRAR